MDISGGVISFLARGELGWLILYFGILYISFEREGSFLLQEVSKAPGLIQPQHFIDRGTELPGTLETSMTVSSWAQERPSRASMSEEQLVSRRGPGLYLWSVRDELGQVTLFSDRIFETIKGSRALLAWTVTGIMWNDTYERPSWHLRVLDKC